MTSRPLGCAPKKGEARLLVNGALYGGEGPSASANYRSSADKAGAEREGAAGRIRNHKRIDEDGLSSPRP